MEERAPLLTLGWRTEIMSPDSDTTRSAAAEAAAAPLDLLLTDAAMGVLRRMNPGGSGLRLAAALAGRLRLVARRGPQPAGAAGPIPAGASEGVTPPRVARGAHSRWGVERRSAPG